MVGADRSAIWAERIARYQRGLGNTRGLVVEGRLTRMVGLTLEAIGCRAAIGGQCDVINSRDECFEAEVVGFAGESLYLMPTGEIRGLEQDARVPTGRVGAAIVGDELLGRVIDGAGRPLDGKGAIHSDERRTLSGEACNPLARMPVCVPNSLRPIGRVNT